MRQQNSLFNLQEPSHSEKQGGDLPNGQYDVICARGETGLVPTRSMLPITSSSNNLRYAARNNQGVSYVSSQRANIPNSNEAGGNGGNGGGSYNFRSGQGNDSVAYAILNMQRSIENISNRLESMENKLNRSLPVSEKIPIIPINQFYFLI